MTCLLVVLSITTGCSSEKINNKIKYTVTFYSDTDTVLKLDEISRNDSAVPPTIPTVEYGKIFTKWDNDFSIIKSDLEIRPICESFVGKDNVFALSGAYGKTSDYAYMNFSLCGNVCLSGAEMLITYDETALSVDSVFNEDGDLVFNTATQGKIILNIASAENILGDVDLCSIKFKLNEQKGEYPVNIEIKSIYANNDEEIMIPEYNLINGTVFVY